MRVLVAVLLVALLVGLVIFAMKKKVQKSYCERVIELGEKAADAYYKTNSSSIVNDKMDASLCKALAAVGEKAAGAAASVVSSGAGRAVVKAAGAPGSIVAGVTSGDAGKVIGALTGADAINQLNYGTPISQQDCGNLQTQCRNLSSNMTLGGPNNDYCREFSRRCRTGTSGATAATARTATAADTTRVRG